MPARARAGPAGGGQAPMSQEAAMERVAEELYALPPDAFVTARDELARSLRSRGDRATAAAVKALRRPTLSVWAANQLSREAGGRLEELSDVGARLEAAQRGAMSGDAGAARELRELTAAARRRILDLVRLGVDLLERGGHQASDPVRQRLESTLRAAIATPESRAALAAGRLTHDLEPAGFGFGDIGGPPAAVAGAPRGRATTRERAPRRAPRRAVAEPGVAEPGVAEREAAEREAAERALAEARAREQAAAERAEAGRQAAERARSAADEARADADRLDQAAAELRQAAEELAERASAALDAARQAVAEAEDLGGAAGAAEERSRAAEAELADARGGREAAERRLGSP